MAFDARCIRGEHIARFVNRIFSLPNVSSDLRRLFAPVSIAGLGLSSGRAMELRWRTVFARRRRQHRRGGRFCFRGSRLARRV